jgi:hypothetical protein
LSLCPKTDSTREFTDCGIEENNEFFLLLALVVDFSYLDKKSSAPPLADPVLAGFLKRA